MEVKEKRKELQAFCEKHNGCDMCEFGNDSGFGCDFVDAEDELIEKWHAMLFPVAVIKGGELKPCPFCGGEAVYENFVSDNRYERAYKPACRILCMKCKAVMGDFVAEDSTFAYKDAATEAWNRRFEA